MPTGRITILWKSQRHILVRPASFLLTKEKVIISTKAMIFCLRIWCQSTMLNLSSIIASVQNMIVCFLFSFLASCSFFLDGYYYVATFIEEHIAFHVHTWSQL